jgi:predicted PurR-regulated permease PerM
MRTRMPDAPADEEGRWLRRMFLTVATVTAVLALLIFLWYAVEVMLIIFAGILLAVVLRSLADLLAEYTGISRGWSLAIVVIGLLALLGLGGRYLAPQIVEQGAQLAVAIPEAFDQVETWIEGQSWGQRFLEQRPGAEDVLSGGLGAVLAQAGGIFSTTLGVIIEVFVVLFLGVYLAVNPDKYVNGIVRLVPIARRERAREVLYALGYTLKWFMLGRLIAMIVVGIVTTIGLMLLNVPLALYVLLLYLVVQNLEGYLLTPLILQGVVSVPPALTIIAEVLGGILFGVLGIILATPFVAVLVVLVKMLYIEDVLGDEAVDVVPEQHARESLRRQDARHAQEARHAERSEEAT